MAFIFWRSAFSVGNNLIDSQHQKLVQIINLLYDEITMKKSELKMQEIFNELVSYTKYHFDAEEQMMLTNLLPGAVAHKKAHQEFISKINTLKLSNIVGNDKVKMEVFVFLKNWLTDHILNTDKETFKSLSEE